MVAASLLVGLWTLWPAGDPRFIGRWRKQQLNPDWPVVEFVFFANCSGSNQRDVPITWRVEGNILFVTIGQRGGVFGLIEQGQNWVKQRRGEFVVVPLESRFYLHEVTPERFTYSPLGSDEVMPQEGEVKITFERVPEK